MVEPKDRTSGDGSIFTEIGSTRRKSAEAVKQILQAVKAGSLKPGQKLPPERMLCTELGISRNSLREALLTLEVLGYIHSRVGNGTYISDHVGRAEHTEEILSLLNTADDMPDLWEARSEIETVIASMAVRTGSDKALMRVADQFTAMQKAVETNDVRLYIELDKSFHKAIARAADNAFLQRVLQPLIDITNDHLFRGLEEAEFARRFTASIHEHEAIVAALTARDESAAIAAIADHFSLVSEYFGKRTWHKSPDLSSTET